MIFQLCSRILVQTYEYLKGYPIDFFEFGTSGSGVDYGDLAATTSDSAGVSSHTRGICMGGKTPTVLDVIQYITMAAKGDSTDFGDITTATYFPTGLSNLTRGVACGGSPLTNVCE